jgi:hypothetical protein
MKRMLVLIFALGLSVGAFAGPLSGTWDVSISIDPGATQAGDLFIDLSSSLAVTYSVGCVELGSSSTFDSIGWSAQSFTASGVLGAFSFSSTMNFKPRTVTSVVWDFNEPGGTSLHDDIWKLWAPNNPGYEADTYFIECWATDKDYLTETYGAAFDDWTVSGSVSIAGIDIEGLFFLEGFAGDVVSAPYAFYYYSSWDQYTNEIVQTYSELLAAPASSDKTLGSGWRFTVGGSCGDMTINSYTYFNLNEKFTTSTCGQSLTKSGTYTIANPDCCMCFTEEYIHIDGFSLGCATFEMGLDITCAGFNWVSFKASGLDLGLCCSGITADFQVTFGTLTKRADLCFDFTVKETACFEFDISLDYSGSSITGVSVDGVTLEYAWNGLTFSSTTLFGGGSLGTISGPEQFLFLVPVTGMTDADGYPIPSTVIDWEAKELYGYFDAYCYDTEYYDLWESFTISSESDACCGGALSFSVTTSFGTKYELDYFAWRYRFNNALGDDVSYGMLSRFIEEGDTVLNYYEVLGMTEAEYDAWHEATWWENQVWPEGTADEEKYVEKLLLGDPIYEEADSDQLFQWASTQVNVSVGLGSAFGLAFGLDIDVYGWNGLDFGFEFAF